MGESPPGSAFNQRKPQVPPLRSAPVGMTNLRAVAHLGMGVNGQRQATTFPPTSRLAGRLRLPDRADQFG
jgi:hypothetical protein